MTILDITRRGTKSEGQEDRGGVFGQAPSWMAWRGIVVLFGQVLYSSVTRAVATQASHHTRR